MVPFKSAVNGLNSGNPPIVRVVPTTGRSPIKLLNIIKMKNVPKTGVNFAAFALEPKGDSSKLIINSVIHSRPPASELLVGLKSTFLDKVNKISVRMTIHITPYTIEFVTTKGPNWVTGSAFKLT